MDHDTAAAYGAADAEHLRQLASSAPRGSVLCDGSMFSPAWRKLPNGEAVFEAAYDDPELIETYTDALDRVADEVGDWDEGMFRSCP